MEEHRISINQLRALVDTLNHVTGNEKAPWSRDKETGRAAANIGNFHLSEAYGGVSLHKMVTEGGGVSDVFNCGHVPKRELYTRLVSFLDGLEYSRG